MKLHIDHHAIPPAVELREPEKFDELALVLDVPDHAYIDKELFLDLARDALGTSPDDDWMAKLDQMVEFAVSRGWTDATGRVRAHIELERSTPTKEAEG